MTLRNRIKAIIVLGIVLCFLVLHDVYWTLFLSILEYESINYLTARISRYWFPILMASIALIISFVLVIGKFLKKDVPFRLPGRRIHIFLPPVLGSIITAAAFLLLKSRRGIPPLEWSAALSFLIFLSLVIFSLFSKRRALILSHVVLAGLAVIVLLIPNVSLSHRKQIKLLDEFIIKEERNNELLQEQIGRIQPKTGLLIKEKGKAAYRFEENLKDIAYINAPQFDSGAGVLFEIKNIGSLIPVQSSWPFRAELVNGALILSRYSGGELLKNREPLDLDLNSIGSFIIRMKTSAGSHFGIYWNEGDQFNTEIGIQIPLASSGSFHTYELKEIIHQISKKNSLEKIDSIYFMPSNRDADIDIEYLRVINRSASNDMETPVKAGYKNIEGEMRRVLFASSPSDVVFNISVPSKSPLLLFGTAVSDHEIPVKFQVLFQEEESEKILFSIQMTRNEHWLDHKIDLSQWAGLKRQIVFRCVSERPNICFWSNPILLDASVRLPNIVIYLVDALRPDHLGLYGYEKKISPAFDFFAQKGVLFENAYSNGCHTRASIPSLFTSNPITSTGVWDYEHVLPVTFPTLTEILRCNGYTTAAFTANDNLGPYSGTHRGFSHLFGMQYFKQEAEMRKEPETRVGDVEQLTGEKFDKWLKKNADRNFFLYIHTVDAHGPYNPPEKYRPVLENEGKPVQWTKIFDPPWLTRPTVESRLALYDGEIRHGDEYFGRFLNKLDQIGILNNTLIVFTADHGEFFGEHGMWGHNPPPYIQGTHIPLSIVWPEHIPAGIRISQNVQILDIMPTILEAAGIDPNQPILQGKSLLPLIKGNAVDDFNNRAIYTESRRPGKASIYFSHFHYIPDKNSLFDLSQDPEEKHYLNSFIFNFGLKSRLRRLSRIYTDAYEILKKLMFSSEQVTLQVNPETLEQMRALGYIK